MSSPNSTKSWSKERLATVYSKFQNDQPEQIANLVNPTINKPLHENSIARAVIVLSAAGLFAMVGWIAFSRNSQPTPMAAETSQTTAKVEDAEGNSEGWKAAATQGTSNGLPVDVPARPSPTPTPIAKPTPVATAVKATPTPIPTPTPQIIYKTNTVYKTLPAPRPVPIPVSKTPPNTQTATRPVIIANATPKTPLPSSFIPLGGAGMVQNRPIRPTRTAIRTKRTPLASENVLLGTTTGATKMTVGTIVPGTTVTGHLLSPMQSNSGGNQGATAIRVALDQPLRTNGGYQLPTGTVVSFAATINPQNGAVSAISGDGWNNGKVISIPPGAISIQSANNQPLIATAFAPKTGDLARADINNALLGAGGEIGNELTKGSSSINVGNGSTIIQNSSNPNIVGAVLKGGFQPWATDQRQRTQTSASQILSAPPIQYLAQNTPVKLTVNSPATIRVAQ